METKFWAFKVSSKPKIRPAIQFLQQQLREITMPSILSDYPFTPEEYPATTQLLELTPTQLETIAEQLGFEDPDFLSRLDKIEDHLNTDMTFEQYVQLMDGLPCPCSECQQTSGMSVVEFATMFLKKVQEAWSTVLEQCPYTAPPNSPTNQEMHAMNGNHIPTDSNWNYVPGVKPLIELANTAHEIYEDAPRIIHKTFRKGKYSSDEAMRHYKAHFAKLGKFYEAGTPEYDQWWSEYQNSLKTPQLKKLRKITNKEQHAKNGNPSKWSWKPEHKDLNAETVWDREAKGENPAHIAMSMGPSNQEMHAYNGNPPKMGPRTKAQHAKTERKKIRNAKKRAETKAYLRVIKSGSAPFPQNRPKKKRNKGVREAGKIDSAEKRLALKYASFMKNPVFTPPRLGSTGNIPTNLIHGYFRTSYNMAAANNLVNATTVIAYISPVMFKQFVTVDSFVSPVTVGFTTTNTAFPSAGGATGDYVMHPFTNDEAMKRQVNGSNNANWPNALARLVGGAITVECRCPMTTTAPPFLYGGLLTQFPATNDDLNTVALNKQLIHFSPNQIRSLPTTADVPGFSVSSVYQPDNAKNLEFNNIVARYCSSSNTVGPKMQAAPIPYVGMVNCPTSAVITITASCWFEYQQISFSDAGALYNTAEYSGWNKGPKLSTEDIFDHLPKIRSVSTRIIGMGAKASSATNPLSAFVERPPTKEINLLDEIKFLREQYEKLRLQIDEEEDEKYFDIEATPSLDKQDTPIYKGLSKSTIDLAMSLKKTLTPGSVTHKTVQSSSQ